MRPLLLLDVDGVLNAVTATPDRQAWSDWEVGTARAGGRAWPVHWSPSVVAAVRGWSERADVQWLTTWGAEANDSLRLLLGLPELPVAGTYEDELAPDRGAPDALAGSLAAVTPAAPDPLSGHWWKFDVVRRLVAEQPERPLVWVDDDLRGREPVRAWMRREARCLLVAPHPLVGLSPPELAAISRYLERA